MYRLLFHNAPWAVDSAELWEEMRRIPPWRRQKALSYHFLLDRVLCVKAFVLLQEGLRQCFGFVGEIEFDYVRHQKPLLKGHPGMHFNLSHCPKGVMCVVADHPVGCDIEEIESDTPDPLLMQRCFHAAEIAQILSDPHPGMAFTRFWTMKEAVLKLTGEGIHDPLPSLLTPELCAALEIITVECPQYGYVYSLAYYKQPDLSASGE